MCFPLRFLEKLIYLGKKLPKIGREKENLLQSLVQISVCLSSLYMSDSYPSLPNFFPILPPLSLTSQLFPRCTSLIPHFPIVSPFYLPYPSLPNSFPILPPLSLTSQLFPVLPPLSLTSQFVLRPVIFHLIFISIFLSSPFRLILNVNFPHVVMEVGFPIANYSFPRYTVVNKSNNESSSGAKKEPFSDQIFIPAHVLVGANGGKLWLKHFWD